jgi:hypothetical protein
MLSILFNILLFFGGPVKSPNPPDKPMLRWWWFGNAVTRTEIDRQLGEMQKAGFGGVELQFVYSTKDSSIQDHPDMPWLGKEWWGNLGYTFKKAHQLGLRCHLTFGQGWPYGGPHVPLEFASRRLVSKYFVLQPGESRTISADSSGHKVQEFQAALLQPLLLPDSVLVIEKTKVLELTGSPMEVKNTERYPQLLSLHWCVPTYQKVKRATTGGEGYVINHLDSHALRLYAAPLLRGLDSLARKDPQMKPDAWFCDSWEVFGENWTPGLLKKLSEAEGHDFRKWLPVLKLEKARTWKSRSPEKDSIANYRYRKTHGETILQQFYEPLARLAHSRKTDVRIQAHDAPTDLIRAYGCADYPEYEGFKNQGINGNYYEHVDPRLAVSAWRIYNRKAPSFEAFTWLGEHFSTSLSGFAKEADAISAFGYRQLVGHGFSYSPKKAAWPGWTFYAASELNDRNSLWPAFPELTQRMERNAAKLLPDNRELLGVYYPIHDHFLGRKNLAKLREFLAEKKLSKAGIVYLNDDALLRWKALDMKRLNIKNLLVLNTSAMPPVVADSLRKRGLKIVHPSEYIRLRNPEKELDTFLLKADVHGPDYDRFLERWREPEPLQVSEDTVRRIDLQAAWKDSVKTTFWYFFTPEPGQTKGRILVKSAPNQSLILRQNGLESRILEDSICSIPVNAGPFEIHSYPRMAERIRRMKWKPGYFFVNYDYQPFDSGKLPYEGEEPPEVFILK